MTPTESLLPPSATPRAAELCRAGLEVLRIESAAVAALAGRIDLQFVAACELCLACQGRIVVTGMGKSGHIARKIAATLASTGSPAFFLHPGEASHGDLGMITGQDVVLALSNSGETDELLTILPLIKRLGVPLIAMTGRPQSTLAGQADAHLDVSVAQEACPLGLAPTASTTAALVMGDALAVSLLHMRGFTREDFARSHPAGDLGRRLLVRICDVMHRGAAVPAVPQDATVKDAVLEMTAKKLGMTTVIDGEWRLLGVFTDGDLRRWFERGHPIESTPVADVMTRGCTAIAPELLAVEAAQLMERRKINALPVVDQTGRLVGALNFHDLLRARVL